MFEVENKFPVPDLAAVEQRLQAYGAQFGQAVEQVDHYFAHPVRDFAKTDEALRLRRIGDSNFVTYKGPKIDQATKTRQELELPLAAGQDLVPRYAQLLLALGFRSVAEVMKRRRSGDFTWQQWSVDSDAGRSGGPGPIRRAGDPGRRGRIACRAGQPDCTGRRTRTQPGRAA